MIKRSSSRNQRSRGIKVKHVLQIIVLVGVCFWLIYQVKRSHDKKKEFDESDSEMSVRTQTAYQIPKLGRKDLHTDKDKVIQNEKHEEEEEEDENIVEDEHKSEHNEHKEGNVHETKEKKYDKHGARGGKEQEENKSEEMEDERGGGDDENEIDEDDQEKPEDDQEKPEVDTDRDEEIVDEEKEKEEEDDEKEKEKSKGEVKLRLVENHNSHEAREENYRGDDASSAVTHDTKTTSTETEMVNLEISDVNSEMGITKSENKPNGTEGSITMRNQPSLDFNITEVKLTGETYSNATSGIEARNGSLSDPVDSSLINNTALTYSDGHSQTSSNLTVMFPGASNNMTGADTSSEHNKTVMFSNQAQNNTVNTTVTGGVKNVQTEGLEQGGNALSEENQSGSNLTVPIKTENGAAAGGESSNLEGGDIEKTIRFVASNENENTGNNEMSETHKTQNSSFVKDNTDATKDEESKGNAQTSDTPDSSSANGTSDSVEQHATDSYDSHTLLKDITEVQTDLDTLPVIKNEGDNNGETATD